MGNEFDNLEVMKGLFFKIESLNIHQLEMLIDLEIYWYPIYWSAGSKANKMTHYTPAVSAYIAVHHYWWNHYHQGFDTSNSFSRHNSVF